MPVPDSEIPIRELVALLTIEALPFAAPGALGLNETVNVAV